MEKVEEQLRGASALMRQLQRNLGTAQVTLRTSQHLPASSSAASAQATPHAGTAAAAATARIHATPSTLPRDEVPEANDGGRRRTTDASTKDRPAERSENRPEKERFESRPTEHFQNRPLERFQNMPAGQFENRTAKHFENRSVERSENRTVEQFVEHFEPDPAWRPGGGIGAAAIGESAGVSAGEDVRAGMGPRVQGGAVVLTTGCMRPAEVPPRGGVLVGQQGAGRAARTPATQSCLPVGAEMSGHPDRQVNIRVYNNAPPPPVDTPENKVTHLVLSFMRRK